MSNEVQYLNKIIMELTEENERLRLELASKEDEKVNWNDIESKYANYYSEA